MRRIANPLVLGAVFVASLATLGVQLVSPTKTPMDVKPQIQPTQAAPSSVVVDRSKSPTINGVALDPPIGQRPVSPTGWAGGPGPIPTNTWWSPLTSGAGAPGLWPLPLMANVDAQGRTSIGTSRRIDKSDGSFEGEPITAMFVEFTSPPAVTSSGAFHATWSYPSSGGNIAMTMIQGSPFVEFEGTGSMRLVVPALRNVSVTDKQRGVPRADVFRRGVTIGTAAGPWVVAASPGTSVAIDGDQIVLKWAATGGRFVAGPVPMGSGPDYEKRAVDVAKHRLIDTTETLRMLTDGQAEQVLRQVRQPAGFVPIWTLTAQQQVVGISTGTSPISTIGTIETVRGTQTVVAGPQLTLRYPSVPVLWSPLPATSDGKFGVNPGEPTPADQLSRGSYFGGKAAATAALTGILADDPDLANRHLDVATQMLLTLAEPTVPPQLVWEDQYGKPVLEPAEFGSLDALNDHQLQYGYWVLAASIVIERRPDLRSAIGEIIELLIADYGGSGKQGTPLDRNGTWSPYDGHSWAAGVTPFGAGNNLESISESSSAWWAAARWMLVTGQPAAAERYLAMLTIESHVTGTVWLPDAAPADRSMRPWSGVVWAGKVDNQTWFDPAPESALGIRLLPLGPMSMSRYHDGAAIVAAERRWAWCADNGGCVSRWSNLLDSDAVVAGRPPQIGPDPEQSTGQAMVAWWRSLWTLTDPDFDLRCSVGTVARRFKPESGQNGTALLISNPGPTALPVTCVDQTGTRKWSGIAAPRSTQLVVI
jgi:endo-1,3(4)-beta-glucanase